MSSVELHRLSGGEIPGSSASQGFNSTCPDISAPYPYNLMTKTLDDVQEVMATGTEWCRELQALKLAAGKSGVVGRSPHTEARAESSSNLGDGATLFS
jgi:hypothetical protein